MSMEQPPAPDDEELPEDPQERHDEEVRRLRQAHEDAESPFAEE